MADDHLLRKAQDLRLAELAVQRGLLLPEQVQEGLRRLEEYERKGIEHTLFDVLLRQGVVEKERWQELRSLSAAQPTCVLPEPPASFGTLALTAGTSAPSAPTDSQRGLPRPGDDFRGYVIQRELGRGGMGIVYEAIQESLKRRVALKILHVHLVADAEMVARFRREAESVARLAHPNIVHVYEFGEAGGLYFYAMEFLEGRTLDAWMRGPDHEVRSAARYVLEAARAVDHAHHTGIIHRDLKPSNLFLTPVDKVYITDFGLARPEEGAGLTLSGSIMGTPIYMSPEQALGARKAVDRRSDVYSLAATLYVLVTRQMPFEGKELHDLLRQVVEEDPTPPTTAVPGLSPDLEAVILKGMAKAREHRYQSAMELAADLRRYLDGEPVEAARRSLFSGRKGRRKLIVSAVVVASGIAVAAVAMGGFPDLKNGATTDGNPTPAHVPVPALPVDPRIPANGPEPGEHSAALEQLEREKRAKEVENLDLKAKICEQQQRYEECMSYLDRALALDPDNADRRRNVSIARYNLGVQRINESRWADALALFDRAAEIDESSPRLWIYRGTALHRLGRTDEAMSSFERSIRLRSDDPEAHLGIARIHVDRGEFDEAGAVVEFALRKAPDSPDLHLFRVDTFLRQRDTVAASAALDEARKVAVAPGALRRMEAGLALARKDFPAAEAAYSEMLRATPGHHEARLGRIQARLGLARWEDALDDLAVLEGDPGPVEPGSLASLRVIASLESGRVREGLDAATAALAGTLPEPLRHNLRYLAGLCRFRLGEWKEAMEDFRAVGASNAVEARDSLWSLAECHFRMGEFGAAEHALRDLLSRWPGDAEASARLQDVRAR